MTVSPPIQFFVMAPDGSQSGPFSRQKMRELYVRGALSPDHRLRRSIDERWFRVRNVTGLFEGLEAGLYLVPEADGEMDEPPGVSVPQPPLAMPARIPIERPRIEPTPVAPLTSNDSVEGPAWIPNEAFGELVKQFDTARTLHPAEARLHVDAAVAVARATTLATPEPGSTPFEIRRHHDGSIELIIPALDPVPEHLRRNRNGPWLWGGFWFMSIVGVMALLLSLAGIRDNSLPLPIGGLVGVVVSNAVRKGMQRQSPYAKDSGLFHWRKFGWHSWIAITSHLVGMVCGMGAMVMLVSALTVRSGRDVEEMLGVALVLAVVAGVVIAIRLFFVIQTYRSRSVRRIGGSTNSSAGIT